jgi:CHAT domain-containing protein
LPLIKRHTEAILASKDLLSQSDAPGRGLYDGLVKPAEPLLKAGGRVYIIGDRELNGLNFETLIREDGHPHYWIEDAVVTNARSLRMLNASSEIPPTRSKGEMLLIGDPIYRASEYASLPNASVEMTRVASHFPAEQRFVISGAQAAPTRYTASSPARFSYIHFVAHATANETSPLDSAIILSGSPDTSKLYAREILKEPLTADLVTLSSCYGSGVRNYSGEGVVGLVWAFLRAGAHSVIGAMWEVSDVSTPELMDALYAKLLTGERPDAALREAKLSLLHSDGVFRKPLYWASFQLYAGR